MGNLLRVSGLILAIFVVLAFAVRHKRVAEPKPTPTSAVGPPSGAPRAKEISRSEYGDRWPFVRLRAMIECVPTNAGEIPVIELGSKRYAFTGPTGALLQNATVVDAEWLDRGDYGYGKIDLTPVRDDAFRFCDTPPPFSPITNVRN